MKTIQAVSLGFAVSLTVCAAASAAPEAAQEQVQEVVITTSPVPELGVPEREANDPPIVYESSLNVGLLRPCTGAAWPSTTWILEMN